MGTSRFREIAGSSAKVGVATVASLLGWVVGGKILALELGAAGVGVFGLLRQLQQNLTILGTFNGSTALVQGMAVRSGDDRSSYSRTVARLYAAGGGVVALVLLVGAPWLGPWLVPDPQGPALLRWLALAVLATTAQAYYTSVLTAGRAVDSLVRSQLMGPVAVLLLAWPMARLVQAGRPAGLVMMLAVPGAAVAVGARIRARRAGLLGTGPGARFEVKDVRAFFRMAGVLLFTGLLTTGTQYLQSRLAAGYLGLDQAGLFWVAWTLSMSYVSVILGSYGTYYMPALSALTEPVARHALIRDYLRLAQLVMPLLVAMVVLFKPWVVLLMFSDSLLPSLQVMRWMLVGDYFKGIAWVLSFPMLAFGELRWFLWTEVSFNVGLAGAAWGWLSLGGTIESLGILFLVGYIVYLAVVWGYIWVEHHFRVLPSEIARFMAGLGLVVGMSAATWTERRVTASSTLLFLVLSAVFVVITVGPARISGWVHSTAARRRKRPPEGGRP